jgi:hypothetical protein
VSSGHPLTRASAVNESFHSPPPFSVAGEIHIVTAVAEIHTATITIEPNQRAELVHQTNTVKPKEIFSVTHPPHRAGVGQRAGMQQSNQFIPPLRKASSNSLAAPWRIVAAPWAGRNWPMVECTQTTPVMPAIGGGSGRDGPGSTAGASRRRDQAFTLRGVMVNDKVKTLSVNKQFHSSSIRRASDSRRAWFPSFIRYGVRHAPRQVRSAHELVRRPFFGHRRHGSNPTNGSRTGIMICACFIKHAKTLVVPASGRGERDGKYLFAGS